MGSSESPDVDDLRAMFARTRKVSDPLDVEMPPGSERWPDHLRSELSSGLKPAGVLIPILQRQRELTILMTRRSDYLAHHPGQVSFPGGRMDRGDSDIVETALRETEEEVGIARHKVSVIGHMRPTPTITGYAVTPTIGLIQEDLQLTLDPGEVADVFEVPLDFLMDTGNYRESLREFKGHEFPVIELRFEGYRIWGATAFMLARFIKHIKNNN